MSNFDFLKSINQDLYQIGEKLEEDVLNSPRAATVDATLFLETLIKDICKRANKKCITTVPFYKKVEMLYRSNVITYSFKKKLLDAYNLRNKIHTQYENKSEERTIALDLHQKLFYISKKYYIDFQDNDYDYVHIPNYLAPNKSVIHFKRCIICGNDNEDSKSNFCSDCNKKIQNANYFLSIKNAFHDEFVKKDLIDYGLAESEAISFIMDLTKENLIEMKGETYYFNNNQFNDYIEKIDSYVEIGILIGRFYKNEISAHEIKNTFQYINGSKNRENFMEFYNIVNLKLENDFENMICESENIKKSIREVAFSDGDVKKWYKKQKELFKEDIWNEAFIKFNEILMNEYLILKRKGFDEIDIIRELKITEEIYNFWADHLFKDDLTQKLQDIKKELLIKALKKDKSLKESLRIAGMTKREFEEIYDDGKSKNDNFYKGYRRYYTEKRQKIFIKHLKKNNLDKAIRKAKITKKQFYDWYWDEKERFSKFYIKTTKILMKKYLKYRQAGKKKKDILTIMGLDAEILRSWNSDEHKIFIQFKNENSKLTSNLIKRGLIINALKDDKSKAEAIESAGITPEEFEKIYETSKKENNDFYIRFDEEYIANRKRLFVRNLADNDFFNAIGKSKISQKEFLKWYLKDELILSDFYLKTTELLMDKYIIARHDGLNKPDSSRKVGLTNIIVDRWMKNPEIPLYNDFIKRIESLTFEFMFNGFRNGKSKIEVSRQYDIPQKTIENYINLGKNGFKPYDEIHQIYETVVIPNQLSIFLRDIESKSFKKALNNSKLSEDEFNHYYNLGKSGNDKFKAFHDNYLRIKIEIYVDKILSRKSPKIALKHSNLTSEEFETNKEKIDEMIVDGRLEILCNELDNHTSTTRLANVSGLTVDEVYSWFFKGKNGESKFEEFALLFDLCLIVPRKLAINAALAVGIPKSVLMNKLKKDIGIKDYKIWQKNGLIDSDEIRCVNIDNMDVDERRIMQLIDSANMLNSITREDDPEMFAFLKRVVESNRNLKFTQNLKAENDEKMIEEILGK